MTVKLGTLAGVMPWVSDAEVRCRSRDVTRAYSVSLNCPVMSECLWESKIVDVTFGVL